MLDLVHRIRIAGPLYVLIEHRHRLQHGVEAKRIADVPGDARPAEKAGRVNGAACHENRSEEHTSELQTLMRNSYAVFCLKKKKKHISRTRQSNQTQSTNSY